MAFCKKTLKFYVEADPQVLQKCKDFIKEHSSIDGNYNVYKSVLNLWIELINSIQESEYNPDLSYVRELIAMEDCPKKYVLIGDIIGKEVLFVRNKETQDTLENLEKIKMNNEPIKD